MKPVTIAAGSVLGLWLLAALAAPLLADGANTIVLSEILAAPGGAEVLGRDDLGRGLAARVVIGARLSFSIAFAVVTIAALVGISIGLAAAWFGGWVDLVLARVIDVFLAFPGILLAIALAGILGPGTTNLVFALSIVSWVGFARLTRAQAQSVVQREHVLVAGALGRRPLAILGRHVLPLLSGPLIVEASFALAAVIVAEAGLSFLGLGVQPPTPSWGSMIRDGNRYLLIAPHFMLVPGLALVSTVIAINLLGDRLADHLQITNR